MILNEGAGKGEREIDQERIHEGVIHIKKDTSSITDKGKLR